MMEKASPFNYQTKITSPELEDSQGVYFAVSTDQMGITSALNIQGQSVGSGIILRNYLCQIYHLLKSRRFIVTGT